MDYSEVRGAAEPRRKSGRLAKFASIFQCFETFSVLRSLSGDAFSPESEAAGFQRFPHQLDHLGFTVTGALADLFKRHAIGPSGPDDPIFRNRLRLWVFGSCLRVFSRPSHTFSTFRLR